MNFSTTMAKYFVLAVIVASLGALIWRTAGTSSSSASSAISVTVPVFSTLAENGKKAFDAVCAACHGSNAAGTDKGPPFIHEIYNPGHHSDEAFFLAAKNGVRQHHWPYGDMPPQPQVTQDQIAAIVRYVRELQAANGIGYRPHRM